MIRFLHSPEELSVSDFYHYHNKALPKLVIVTQGYCGEIGIETYDRDQVLRIHTTSIQRRVVADVIHKTGSNLEGKHLSIPLEYPTKFYVINKHGQRSKKDSFLSEIVKKYGKSFPVTVEFSDKDNHTVLVGSELRSTSYFQQLSLVDTYEDIYLLGNPIANGKLYSKVLSVPLYLQDMRMSIVTGIEGYSSDVWQKYNDGMAASVKNQVVFDETSGNKNIAVYKKSSGTNYALTSPCEYYNMGDVGKPTFGDQFNNDTQPKSQNQTDNAYSCIYEHIGMEALPQNPDIRPQKPIKVLPSIDPADKKRVLVGSDIPPKRPPPLMPKPQPSQTNVPADQSQQQNKTDTAERTRPKSLVMQNTQQFRQENDSETEKTSPSVQMVKTMFEKNIEERKLSITKKSDVPVSAPSRRPRISDEDYGLKFEHLPEEYNLKDFYERFNSALPKVVTVTQGYYGEIGLETYDKDQVIRIHTYSQQKRVVCKVIPGDEDYAGLKGKYLTIPINYPVKFNVIKHGSFLKSKSKDLSLTEVIETYQLPVQVQFSKAEDGTVISIDSREINTKLFNRLEIVETYEEIYLLGNPITFGKLYSNIMSIPVYLPDIKLSVVIGVKDESKESWDVYVAGMNRSVNKTIKFDQTSGNANIAIYSATRFDTGDSKQYTYQYPTEYYNMGELQTPTVDKKQPRASGFYEEIVPVPRKSPVCLYEPVSFKRHPPQPIPEEPDPPPSVPMKPKPIMDAAQTVALPVPRKGEKYPEESKEKMRSQTPSNRVLRENKSKTMPPVIDRANKPIMSAKTLNLKEFEFEYNRDQLSVKEFYKLYKNDLPKLTMVTQGYCGNISLETYARGEILRIHKCLTQKRVIAEAAGHQIDSGIKGQKFSIPLDIDCKFRVVKHGHGKELSLNEIVKKQLPVEVKFSKSHKNKTLMIGSDERSTGYFNHLAILDVYDDLYLLGNTLSDGCLYGKIVSVPAYLPNMKLCIITGIKGQSNDDWKSYLSDMQNVVDQKVNFGICSGNKDIAIYDSDEIKVDSAEFPFVSPNIYTNLEELLQGKIEKPCVERISSDLYDEIPADKVKETESLKRPGSLKTKTTQYSCPPMVPERDKGIPDNKSSVSLPTPPVIDRRAVPLPTPPVTVKQSVNLSNPLMPSERNKPFDIKQYTITEISSFLRQINLEKHIKRFADSQVDGVILAELDMECLLQDFRFKKHQAIKLLNFAQTGHIPTMERSLKPLSEKLKDSDDDRIDVQSLTVLDICDSLRLLNLGRHVGLFEKELIDGSILVDLSESDLKNLGLTKFEAVKLITFATKGHIPKIN